MAFVRRETPTAGSGSPAQQRSALRGLPLTAAAGLSLLAAACGGGSSRAYGRAKGFLRPARDVVHVTVLQPSTSYNGLMTFRALALVGMTGLTLAASACGGSSAGKVAQVGTVAGTNGSDSRDPVAWSACMRSHGVPTFPDPDSSGRIQIPSSIDDRLPTVRAAYRACRNLAPSESSLTGQGDTLQQDRLLAFAKCMRSHGVPNFPDPQVVNGHIRIHVTAGQIDPSSPIVTAAMATCRSTLGANSARGAEKLVQGAAGRPTGGKGGKGK
jgi:hypothetical protein